MLGLQQWRSRLLSELVSLRAAVNTNIFATSRPNHHIEEEFQGRLSQDILASNNDVHDYLDGHMMHMLAFVLKRPHLQEEIKEKISKAVDGMHLTSHLSLRDKTSPRDLKNALEEIQNQNENRETEIQCRKILSGAYDDVMERINGQQAGFRRLAKMVPSWITCAQRSLTVIELRHTLAVRPGDHQLDGEDLRDIADITAVCAGLVTVDEESNIVRLVHYTTQEYFKQTQDR